MLRSIFIANKNGEVIAEKNYIGIFDRHDLEPILKVIQLNNKIPPLFESFGTTFLIHNEGDIYFIAVCDGNESILTFTSQFIVNTAKLISSLIKGGLTGETIKTEYPMLYKVLDQAVDEGYPFLDEPSCLIASFSGVLDTTMSVDRRFPWRGTTKTRGNPEFMISVVEYIDAHISCDGKINLNVVRGNVNVFCRIDGDPLVGISFFVPKKFVEVSYHRCVDAKQHLARRIQFVPSDGSFCLMKYVAEPSASQLPLFITPKFSWSSVSVVFEIILRSDPNLTQKLTNIQISFDLPEGISMPSMASIVGTTDFIHSTRTVVWKIDSLGNTPPILNGSASITNLTTARSKSIFIHAQFVAPNYTYSGLKVDNFDIETNAKNLTKGIKYSTKSGVYDFNTV